MGAMAKPSSSCVCILPSFPVSSLGAARLLTGTTNGIVTTQNCPRRRSRTVRLAGGSTTRRDAWAQHIICCRAAASESTVAQR